MEIDVIYFPEDTKDFFLTEDKFVITTERKVLGVHKYGKIISALNGKQRVRWRAMGAIVLNYDDFPDQYEDEAHITWFNSDGTVKSLADKNLYPIYRSVYPTSSIKPFSYRSGHYPYLFITRIRFSDSKHTDYAYKLDPDQVRLVRKFINHVGVYHEMSWWRVIMRLEYYTIDFIHDLNKVRLKTLWPTDIDNINKVLSCDKCATDFYDKGDGRYLYPKCMDTPLKIRLECHHQNSVS